MSGSPAHNWCTVCCTSHGAGDECPGILNPIGPERKGWKTHVRTGTHIEIFGVLLAPCEGVWRSRIMTYPRSLWSIPGDRTTMKFTGRTPEEAEQRAAAYIRKVCSARGYRLDDEVIPSPDGGAILVTRRKPRRIPVRYGPSSISSYVGLTHNVSVGGMFIGTDLPLEGGEPLAIEIGVSGKPCQMNGVVVWHRVAYGPETPRGMGVRLIDPPSNYNTFVKSLD